MNAPPGSSLRECLRHGSERLHDHSDSARLDAELLLAHVLDKPRSYLYAWPESTLAPAPRAAYERLLEERARGRPVAQLTGLREFWSLPLRVNADVLCPRPETELLVETALQLGPPGPARVLDLGTGSGAIAIAVAHERADWRLTAVDRSAAALATAADNARRLGVDGRLRLLRSDWFEALAGECFELILANPPYIADDDPHLRSGALRHEPPSALRAGADGLDDLRRIVDAAPDRLAAGGWLLLEHGWTQGAAVRGLLDGAGFEAVASRCDLGGRERLSLGRRGPGGC